MEEGRVHEQVAFVADNQATEVAQPGEGALDLPASAIAAQLASVLGLGPLAIAAIGADQLHPAVGQCLAEGKWDACNNVEGVIIPSAFDGTYTVIVHAFNVAQGGSQPFALVVSGDDLQEEGPPTAEHTVYLQLMLKNQ